MDFPQVITSIVTGVSAAGLTIWAQGKVHAWRLRALESRMAKTEENVSELQQRTAGLEARI